MPQLLLSRPTSSLKCSTITIQRLSYSRQATLHMCTQYPSVRMSPPLIQVQLNHRRHTAAEHSCQSSSCTCICSHWWVAPPQTTSRHTARQYHTTTRIGQPTRTCHSNTSTCSVIPSSFICQSSHGATHQLKGHFGCSSPQRQAACPETLRLEQIWGITPPTSEHTSSGTRQISVHMCDIPPPPPPPPLFCRLGGIHAS